MPSSVFAQTIAISAIVPFVIHIFVPFNIYPPSTFFALVCMPLGLDPKSGSVKPKHPIALAEVNKGNHLFFCSSLPYAKIGYITNDPCTDTNDLTPESHLSNS